jgi:plasmid maintenance system antidote protein VapI
VALLHPAIRLARWCVRTGNTQAALARLLGISQPSANRILHRQFCPSAELAARIESVTGLPADAWTPHRVKRRFRSLVKADRVATVAA